MSVLGTPTVKSTVACVGQTTGLTSVRVSEVTVCTITVRDGSSAPTTGFADDFAAPLLVGGASPSAITSIEGGAKMTFTVVAPTTVQTFSVRGRLAGPTTNFDQSAFALAVVGTPTDASTVACVGLTSSSATTVKTSETVRCTITVADAGGPAVGLPSDFGAVNIVGGSALGSFVKVGGGEVITFTLQAPAEVDATFTIQATLADTTVLNTVTMTVLGRPTIASTLACAGSVTLSATAVRASESVTCTITVRDAVGTTKGAPADFAAPSTVGGGSISALTSAGGGATMTFTLTAPSTPGAAFQITGRLAGNTVFAEVGVMEPSMLRIGHHQRRV